MNGQNWVEICDRTGWRKVFPLDKTLIHVGSDAQNDIVLESWRGTGVAPRHLQLIAVAGSPHYRAINLGNADVLLADDRNRALSPRSSLDIFDGDRLTLGEFSLTFHLGHSSAIASAHLGAHLQGPASIGQPPASAAISASESSASIGLSVSLPGIVLQPDRTLEGVVTVRNQGEQPGVQFKLEVEGLEPDCYDIGPGPILFPSAQKDVFLHLHHPKRPEPPAGRHQIRIHASAAESYPGERVTVVQEIQIAPYYHHLLRLVPAKVP
jgi:hypothetical protein